MDRARVEREGEPTVYLGNEEGPEIYEPESVEPDIVSPEPPPSLSTESERRYLGYTRKELSLNAKLLILSLTLTVLLLLIWIFRVGPEPNLSGPVAIPTAIATPTERTVYDPWKNFQWLSAQEARILRTQANVVNIALLQGGGAFYSKDLTIQFPATFWDSVTAKVPTMRNYLVAGTTVQFDLNNDTYNLNLLMPFAHEQDRGDIYVFDPTGKLWRTTFEKAQFVRVEQLALPIQVAPNNNLTFTIK